MVLGGVAMARRRARRCWTYRTGGGLVRGYGRAHARASRRGDAEAARGVGLRSSGELGRGVSRARGHRPRPVCGAVDAADHFCLEGRCDACVFENCETEEPVRGCQTEVEMPMRLWMALDDAFSGDAGDDDDW